MAYIDMCASFTRCGPEESCFLEDGNVDGYDDEFNGYDSSSRNRPAEQKRQHLFSLVAG